MVVTNLDIPESHGYLLPIGDLHRGDRHLSSRGLKKLKGYFDWIMERPNAYIFLMGDILNVAGKSTKSNPGHSRMTGSQEYVASVKLFEPVKSRIIGCITGNHEQRMDREFSFNPLVPFCNELGINYCGFSSCLKIRVGKRKESENAYEQIYWGFAHHGKGGGSTLGSALNNKAKLQDIVHGMDFYMAGHDHQLAVGTRNVLLPKRDNIEHQRVHYIDTGSFLDWDESYAEEAGMPISKQGAPRIRLDGREKHHDVHVSI